MTNQSTIDKLIEMRLSAMADAFHNQLNDPKMKEVSFKDRFGMEACKQYYNTKYVRLPDLLIELDRHRNLNMQKMAHRRNTKQMQQVREET